MTEMTKDELERLKGLAEKATPGDLSTAEHRETGDHYECPACQTEGYVDGETFTNFDDLAMGVQFFGAGKGFREYEEFFRAFNPQTVLALLSALSTREAELAEVRGALEPFAEASEHLHPSHADGDLTLDGIEVRHWRAAWAAINRPARSPKGGE